MELAETLSHLANQRPLFHAEKDFQFALAWRLQEQYPRSSVRLERPAAARKGRIYVDIWIEEDGKRTAIELKYKTRRLETTVVGEPFRLRDQSAQDTGRYDFLADIVRIEELVAKGIVDQGMAVLLTNDPTYWQDARNRNTNDWQFRLYDGRELQGTLAWTDKAGAGSIRGRERPIILSGTHTVAWLPYSTVSDHELQYLMIEV